MNQLIHSAQIPTEAAKLKTGDSDALKCFVDRQFSSKLQDYMLSYVMAMNSFYPLYTGFTK